jgi:hypothetical protein
MEGKGSTHNVAKLQQIKKKNGISQQIKFKHNRKNKWCGWLYIKAILSMIHKEKFKSIIATQL